MSEGARLLGRHRRMVFAVGAALLAGLGAALATPPPGIGGADAGGRSAFAALASAAIVALAILPFMVWRRVAQPTLWVAAALVALALGIGYVLLGRIRRSARARRATRTSRSSSAETSRRSARRIGRQIPNCQTTISCSTPQVSQSESGRPRQLAAAGRCSPEHISCGYRFSR